MELIRFFYTYLSDFAWIILSKNFRKTLSSSSSTVPPVSRVQRYDFFIYLQLFSKLFSIFFHFVFISLVVLWLQRRFSGLFMKKTGFLRNSAPFSDHFRTPPATKISQNRKKHGKTGMVWRRFFRGAGTGTGVGNRMCGCGDGSGCCY